MQLSCILIGKKVLYQIHSSSKRWLCSSSVHTFNTEIYHLEVWNTFLAFESNSASFRDFLWLVIRPCWLRSSCQHWRSSCTSGCIVPSFSSFTSNISSNKVMASSILKTKSNLQWDRWSCREISTTTIKGNTTMSAVITSWEPLTKWQTITFITNGSDKLPWLPTEFISSQQWV